ncbi:MAG: NUMOD4 domain-containing protein [Candidatus Dormibacteria bacterium]
MSELTCSTPGCDSSPAARGLCSKHYMRQRRSGSLTYPGFDPPLPRPGERWRPVVGYVGLYEVSDLGNVRSVDRVVTCRDGAV